MGEVSEILMFSNLMCNRLLDKLIKHTTNAPDNFLGKCSHILIFACR